jgi:hypothetical protein
VDLKNQLKSGVETSLAKAQLLKTTKFETLQAFVAYLVCGLKFARKSSLEEIFGS